MDIVIVAANDIKAERLKERTKIKLETTGTHIIIRGDDKKPVHALGSVKLILPEDSLLKLVASEPLWPLIESWIGPLLNKGPWRKRGRVCDPNEIRTWYESYKAQLKCKICKGTTLLCFHHRDPSTKINNVCNMLDGTFTKEEILEEIAKCDVLCFLCHHKTHSHSLQEVS